MKPTSVALSFGRIEAYRCKTSAQVNHLVKSLSARENHPVVIIAPYETGLKRFKYGVTLFKDEDVFPVLSEMG